MLLSRKFHKESCLWFKKSQYVTKDLSFSLFSCSPISHERMFLSGRRRKIYVIKGWRSQGFSVKAEEEVSVYYRHPISQQALCRKEILQGTKPQGMSTAILCLWDALKIKKYHFSLEPTGYHFFNFNDLVYLFQPLKKIAPSNLPYCELNWFQTRENNGTLFFPLASN